MTTTPEKKDTAMAALLDCFGEIIESGAAKMDDDQLRESEKRFHAAIYRA